MVWYSKTVPVGQSVSGDELVLEMTSTRYYGPYVMKVGQCALHSKMRIMHSRRVVVGVKKHSLPNI